MPKEERLGYYVFVKVDCGYQFDGVDPEREEAIDIVRIFEVKYYTGRNLYTWWT